MNSAGRWEQELLEAIRHQTACQMDPPPDFRQRLDMVHNVLTSLPDQLPVAGPALVVLTQAQPRVVPLSGPMLVGASSDSDLRLDCPCVSRRHGCIRPVEEDWLVEDMQSTNGVFVNGRKIVFKLLSDGDVLQFGSVLVLFLARPPQNATPPADRA